MNVDASAVIQKLSAKLTEAHFNLAMAEAALDQANGRIAELEAAAPGAEA